jgi:hypothetical protein
MRESVAREFIEMSTAYAKHTAHVRKQFETSAGQTQHHTTLAQKVTTEAAQTIQAGVAKTFNKGI